MESHTEIAKTQWLSILKVMSYRRAINCPGDECFVGDIGFPGCSTCGSYGTIEVSYVDGYVQTARVLFPLFGKGDDDKVGQIVGLAIGSSLLQKLAENGLNSEQVKRFKATHDSIIGKLRKDMASCGAASLFVPSRQESLIVTTANEKGWLSIDILPIGFAAGAELPFGNYDDNGVLDSMFARD